MTEPDWLALDAAWQPARRAGVLGSATTESLIAHAAGYLPAACRVDVAAAGIDLGTGAGVPGVIVAALWPDSTWVLVDGNERRCEYAQGAVRALGLSARVSVVHSRVEELAHSSTHRGAYDLVVARSFGEPADLAECALPLLAPSGQLVVSVVAETLARWREACARFPLEIDEYRGGDDTQFVAVSLTSPVSERWPRRPSARRRSPIF